jgi:hypothetical protein
MWAAGQNIDMSQPAYEREYEALYGTVIAGRYKLVRLCDQREQVSDKEIGWLYQGTDMQTNCEVGVRVVQTPEDHRRLHDWLAVALLSHAREAILAVGHLDRKRTYVVFSAAVLSHWSPLPPPEDETAEDAEKQPGEEPRKDTAGETVVARLKKLLTKEL